MLKATGIVRKVDDLGRIVIPKELRRVLNIQADDCFDYFTRNDEVILRKREEVYSFSCAFCSSQDNLKELNGKNYCEKCAEKISENYRKDK